MKELCEALKGQFTIVNLGCIGDPDYRLPQSIVKALTIVEVDAEGGARTTNPYHRKIVIEAPISGTPGKHTFIRNTFAGTCSLLRPLPGKVAAFGIEDYCREIEKLEMECETIPTLLKRQGVAGLDFLKTDVEGLDAAIIRSCEEYLGKTLFIQCELRFEPFYETEPCFHEVVSYLANHGYEVLDILHIDRWKYKTPHQNQQLHGRAIWADFLFVMKPDRLSETFGADLPLAVAKMVIIACMVGKKNYGEYLLQRFDSALPETWKRDLAPLVKPTLPNWTQIRQGLRRTFMPLELFLKHRISRSKHVSVRLGN